MTPDELTERATDFGRRVVQFIEPLFARASTREIADQLNRAAPAIGAGHRAARLGRSRKEFVARIAVPHEEADESHYWLAFLKDARLASGDELSRLIQEAHELRAIFGRSVGTSRRNYQERNNARRRPRRRG